MALLWFYCSFKFFSYTFKRVSIDKTCFKDSKVIRSGLRTCNENGRTKNSVNLSKCLNFVKDCEKLNSLLRCPFVTYFTFRITNFAMNFFLKNLPTRLKYMKDPLLMSKRLMPLLFFPFIPHSSKSIIDFNTIAVIISICTIAIGVIICPFRYVSRQIGQHARFDKCYIQSFWNELHIVSICVEIVNQR